MTLNIEQEKKGLCVDAMEMIPVADQVYPAASVLDLVSLHLAIVIPRVCPGLVLRGWPTPA